jgi:hypothetical protein
MAFLPKAPIQLFIMLPNYYQKSDMLSCPLTFQDMVVGKNAKVILRVLMIRLPTMWLKTQYALLLHPNQPELQLVLGGSSMGGVIALLIGHRLMKQGQWVFWEARGKLMQWQASEND